MNLSEDIFDILMMEPGRNYNRKKIKKKLGGKNLFFDQDIHCNQQ